MERQAQPGSRLAEAGGDGWRWLMKTGVVIRRIRKVSKKGRMECESQMRFTWFRSRRQHLGQQSPKRRSRFPRPPARWCIPGI